MRHNHLDYATIHVKTLAANAATGMAYKGRTPVAFFFEGDKRPHFRCPPGTRRAGRWTDRLGTDCDLQWGDVARQRIGEALQRIGGDLRGEERKPRVRPDLQRRLFGRGGTRPLAPGEGRAGRTGNRVGLAEIIEAVDPGGTTVGRGFRTWLRDRRAVPTPEAPPVDRTPMRERIGRMIDQVDDRMRDRNRRGLRTWMDDLARRANPDASTERSRRGRARRTVQEPLDAIEVSAAPDASVRTRRSASRATTGSSRAMAASSDVAGRSARRRAATPNLDAPDPQAEQLQLVPDRSNYPQLRQLFDQRESILDKISYWEQARNDFYDDHQNALPPRHPDRIAQVARIEEYRKQGIYGESDVESLLAAERTRLRDLERDIRDTLAPGSLRRARTNDERGVAMRARLGQLGPAQDPQELQRLGQNYARIDLMDGSELDVRIEALNADLQATQEGIRDLRRQLRLDDPAKRDQLQADLADFRQAERDQRALLVHARQARAERADPNHVAILEDRRESGILTRDDLLRELLLLDPSPERDVAIERVRGSIEQHAEAVRQGGQWVDLWDNWNASNDEELTDALDDWISDNTPDVLYQDMTDVFEYGDPQDALDELNAWLENLTQDEDVPQDHPHVVDAIHAAAVAKDLIEKELAKQEANKRVSMPIGGNAPRPNPPAAIPGITGKAETGWQQGLIPEAEIPVRPELADLTAAKEHLRQGGSLAEIPDDVLVQALFLDGVVDTMGDSYDWTDLLFAEDQALSDQLDTLMDMPLENDRFRITLTKYTYPDYAWSQWAVFRIEDKTTGDVYFLKGCNYGRNDAVLEAVGYDVARLVGFRYDEQMGQVRLGIVEDPGTDMGAVRWQLQPHVAIGQDAPLNDPKRWSDAEHIGLQWDPFQRKWIIPDVDPTDFAAMIVLDYLTDNADRHIGNWKVGTDDDGVLRVLPIDMGLAFGGRMQDLLAMGLVNNEEDWDGFLEARARLLPEGLVNDDLGTSIFGYVWQPDYEDQVKAEEHFNELIERIRQVNVDDLFDPARYERRGAKLTAGERAHLAAAKQLFLTRLAILEERGPAIFFDAYGI